MQAHTVRREDRSRIQCARLYCDASVDVCEHAPFKAGGTRGISFWYTCTAHAAPGVVEAARAKQD